MTAMDGQSHRYQARPARPPVGWFSCLAWLALPPARPTPPGAVGSPGPRGRVFPLSAPDPSGPAPPSAPRCHLFVTRVMQNGTMNSAPTTPTPEPSSWVLLERAGDEAVLPPG